MDPLFNGSSQFLPLVGAKLIQEEAEKSQTKENGESVKATGEAVPVDSQQTSTLPIEAIADGPASSRLARLEFFTLLA
jgi:hypothetical protein